MTERISARVEIRVLAVSSPAPASHAEGYAGLRYVQAAYALVRVPRSSGDTAFLVPAETLCRPAGLAEAALPGARLTARVVIALDAEGIRVEGAEAVSRPGQAPRHAA